MLKHWSNASQNNARNAMLLLNHVDDCMEGRTNKWNSTKHPWDIHGTAQNIEGVLKDNPPAPLGGWAFIGGEKMVLRILPGKRVGFTPTLTLP